MSRLDEPVDRGHVVQSARMTIAGHYRRTCQCCTPDGCPQLHWAREQLAHLAPPPTVDRPNPTAGEQRRTA